MGRIMVETDIKREKKSLRGRDGVKMKENGWYSDDVFKVSFVNFVDYHTLRVGGLVFAGVIVFLSIILLAGKSSVTP